MPKIIKTASPHEVIQQLKLEISKNIVGMDDVVHQILLAYLNEGHVLLEGVPGLAKTTLVKTFSACIGHKFKRVQFSPDLLPADIVGTQIYDPKSVKFNTRIGPIFTNMLMADEINRAPSKVQSALLEAMEEKQVTIAEKTYKLPRPYMVLATQNPLEQEGTYPLPEAQLDRFMLKIIVNYPSKSEEKNVVLKKIGMATKQQGITPLSESNYTKLRESFSEMYIDEKLIEYIVRLVSATREPQKYNIDPKLITYGASPRASIFLAMAARANAFLYGETYTSTSDIKEVAYPVLRHRIGMSYEAGDMSSDELIAEFLNVVESP